MLVLSTWFKLQASSPAPSHVVTTWFHMITVLYLIGSGQQTSRIFLNLTYPPTSCCNRAFQVSLG